MARLHALFVHRRASFFFSLLLRFLFPSPSRLLPSSSFCSPSFSAFVRRRTCRPSFSTGRRRRFVPFSVVAILVPPASYVSSIVASCCIASPSLTVVPPPHPLRLLSRLFFVNTRPRFVKQTRPRFAETALCHDSTDGLSTPRGLTTFVRFHSRLLIQPLFLYPKLV